MKQQNQVVAYIGLGSNLTDPIEQIKSARQAIKTLPSVKEKAFSSLYRSAPMGPQDQPDYINAVMAVMTSLEPMALLRALQAIENQHGRVRERRWGARTLDLDILLYDQRQIRLPELIVPHSGLSEREFVLYPLQEIAGDDLSIPGQGCLSDLIQSCPLNGLQRLSK
jgi:2-amino-4-hydroxy-6-hydroxymethyldihydropteridine diphosphokinase